MPMKSRNPEYATFGYIREQLLNENDEYKAKYPIELNQIIASFVGNILLRLDITNEQSTRHIQNDGQILKRVFCKVRTATSWNISSGTTKIRIKCQNASKNDTIGIASRVDWCKMPRGVKLSGPPVYNYRWLNGYCFMATRDGFTTFSKARKLQSSINAENDPWLDGDVIRIDIDCDKSTIVFYKNNEKKASFDIKEGLEYHLIICLDGNRKKSSVYQLLY